MNFYNILNKYEPYRSIVDNFGNTPISVAGITESAQGHLIASLVREKKCSALVVVYSDMDAWELKRDLQMYAKNVLLFPSSEYIFYNIETSDRTRRNERLNTLSELAFGKENIVVASLDALLEYTIRRDKFFEYSIDLSVGGNYDINEISQKLIKMGYTREDLVEGVGQFSIRGEILDVFSPSYENPVRIDFFDTEAETIRFFDPLSQRSAEEAENVRIIAETEAVMDEEKCASVVRELEAALENAKKSGNEEEIKNIEADIDNFTSRFYFPSIDRFAYDIYGEIPSVLDYMSPEDLVFIIEPRRIRERGKSFENEKGELITELKEKSILGSKSKPLYLTYNEAVKKMNSSKIISLNTLNHTKDDFKYKKLVSFVTKTTISFHGKMDYLYEDLERCRESRQTVVILAANRSRGENLEGVLKDKGFDARYIHDEAEFKEGELVIVRGNQSKGFEYPDINFVLICDNEIFDSSKRQRRKKNENANRLKSYNDISAGDYVVHEANGIGRYVGTQKITVGGITKEYLKIQYRGTDILYVPIDQLDLLYKYVGNQDRELKLNKLGTQDWSKTKQKIKASTAEVARQLIKLYAERMEIKGYAFSPDSSWQREFEDRFPFVETEDQLRSIEEVKQDMERQKPMDRLLCGDVGFGKTEVALRAAFKAVSDSKQVAYFCPTTILAMQHYETFLKRMEGFPVKVEMLSRFRSASASKRIIKQLKTGEIDIVIGTHKLLSKNVEFKDLGLLVIDEEQRFGVVHKERLKELKKSVDVLTMTATPIPRTLHMAMTSVRDMSLLTEPPRNRYPVQTYVLEENESVIINAVRNELSRGGQVFYLHNRVEGLYAKAELLKKHFPQKSVAVGHGKMREEELEDIMADMVNGNIDVLVCTTIIETGLDIPNANTIIIEDADRMGLAQLYQLRGRVGRSNRAAYAYLTYKRDRALSETASKRLRAIKEFTEFGSGFKIAMRDLEIRGAGNLLGAEQHGHMDSVGYDMYCKLLKESINEVQNIVTTEDMQVTIELEMNAYLPDDYVVNQNQRIDMYKRIAGIATEDDRCEIEEEMQDRYGQLPSAAENLIAIAAIKPKAREQGIFEISRHGGRLVFKFTENVLDATLIWELDGKFPNRIKVSSGKEPAIEFKTGNEDIIEFVNNILNVIKELKNPEK